MNATVPLEDFLPLIRALLRKTGHRHERLLTADDFIQEALLALSTYMRRHPLSAEGLAPPYAVIIRAGFIEAYRHAGVSNRRTGARKIPEPLYQVSLDDLAPLEDPSPPVELVVDHALQSVRVWRIVDTLPAKESRLMTDLFLKDLTQREVSWRTGVTDGRISQLKLRALRRLRYPPTVKTDAEASLKEDC